jgi:hypothetical protein
MRYLIEAIFAGVSVSGFRVPVNLIAVAAAGVLGLVHPGFWIAGAVGEVLFLGALIAHPRFRRAVDAKARVEAIESSSGRSSAEDLAEQKRKLILRIHPDLRIRLGNLQKRLDTARRTQAAHLADDFRSLGLGDALDQLEWVYLKLLVARDNLVNGASGAANASTLERQLAEMDRKLATPDLSDREREALAETRRLTGQRLSGARGRAQALAEIDGDLLRVEAQADLAVESTSMESHARLRPDDLGLATRLLDASLYGASAEAIASVDRWFEPDSAPPSHAASSPAKEAG